MMMDMSKKYESKFDVRGTYRFCLVASGWVGAIHFFISLELKS